MRELPQFLLRTFRRSHSVTFLRHGSALGDVLMLSALARGLKKARPDVHIAIVSKMPALFLNNPNIDENRGWHLWRCGRTVAARYTAADLTPDHPHQVETQWRRLWRELTESKFPGADPGKIPALDGVHSDIFLTPEERAVGSRLLGRTDSKASRRPAVLMVSGGKLTPTHNREWGAANFQAVADALAPHTDLFQINGGAERLIANGKPIGDLRNLRVRESAAVFAECDAMLVQEGGAMHLARAVNASCVTVFGGFVRAKTAGYPEIANFVGEPECSPCIPLRKNCFHLKCMAGITPKKVVAALAEKIRARCGVLLPQSAANSPPDFWTPPPFVDRELLARELEGSVNAVG